MSRRRARARAVLPVGDDEELAAVDAAQDPRGLVADDLPDRTLAFVDLAAAVIGRE
jgi:hypothetical protein